MVSAPNPWTCIDCRAENSADNDCCIECGLRRSESDSLRYWEDFFGYRLHHEPPVLRGFDLLALLTLPLLGIISFLISLGIGVLYLLVVGPILGATIRRTFQFGHLGVSLPLGGKLFSNIEIVLVLLAGYAAVFLLVYSWISYISRI